MVLSKINSSISYPELKKTNPEDSNMETDLYEISVKGVDVVIAVGNPRHDFQKKNVVYYPVYLVKKNNKVAKLKIIEKTILCIRWLAVAGLLSFKFGINQIYRVFYHKYKLLYCHLQIHHLHIHIVHFQ